MVGWMNWDWTSGREQDEIVIYTAAIVAVLSTHPLYRFLTKSDRLIITPQSQRVQPGSAHYPDHHFNPEGSGFTPYSSERRFSRLYLDHANLQRTKLRPWPANPLFHFTS